MLTTEPIELTFNLVVFFNALLFAIQAIKIFQEKTSQSVSLLAFFGLFLIQIIMIIHGITHHHLAFIMGSTLSMITCGLVVILIRLYDRRKISGAIHLSLEEIMDQLPGHIYWKDIHGVLLGCNAKNWQDFGLESFSELQGKTDFDIFPEPEAKKIREIDQYVMQTGQLQVIEEIATGKNQSTVTYLSHKVPLKNKQGEIVGILGHSLDITKSKHDISDQLNMLENIIAMMPGHVYWMNTDGVYLGCNDNQMKAIGAFSKEQIIGKTNAQIPGFLIPDILDDANQQVIETGKEITIEEPAILKDGKTGTFLSNKVPLRNTKGKIIGMVGISVDITERKASEEALKKAKELAEIANQSKTEFLENMRHDLRTPFSGLLGLAECMEREETNLEKKKNLSLITESAQVLLKQMNEIFEFLQLENGQLPILEKEFDLYGILDDISAVILPSIKNKAIDFNLIIDEKLPRYVIGDAVRIQRILLNLLTNAVKFTQQGRIQLTVKVKYRPPQHAIVIFIVEDTGIGIPNDKKDIIFERFNRLTPSYRGLYDGKGLGLRIVKQFLDEINGRCYLTSQIDHGTQIKILVPYPLPLLSPEEMEDQSGTFLKRKSFLASQSSQSSTDSEA